MNAASEIEAIVDAYIRAHHMNDAVENGHPDDAETQFAWHAHEGAKARIMACGVSGPRHAAMAVILAADKLDNIVSGMSVGNVIPIDDELRTEVAAIRKALENTWSYLHKKGAADLLPIAKSYGFAENVHA